MLGNIVSATAETARMAHTAPRAAHNDIPAATFERMDKAVVMLSALVKPGTTLNCAILTFLYPFVDDALTLADVLTISTAVAPDPAGETCLCHHLRFNYAHRHITFIFSDSNNIIPYEFERVIRLAALRKYALMPEALGLERFCAEAAAVASLRAAPSPETDSDEKQDNFMELKWMDRPVVACLSQQSSTTTQVRWFVLRWVNCGHCVPNIACNSFSYIT